jgi:hypothetical protein
MKDAISPRLLPLTVALMVSLAACSTSPITLAEASPGQRYAFAERGPDTVLVTVIRDAGIQSSACATDITVNGQPAGAIRPSQAIQLHIPAGEVIMGANTACFGTLVERETRLVAGRPQAFRVAYDHNGSLIFSRTVAR